MNTALAERADVTYDGEIIETPPAAPLTLFGTDNPALVMERATSVATVLADVIQQKRLSARIGNRDHVLLEGWTLLGSMLGVFGHIDWTRQVDNGWEARAVARTLSGAVVGSAEAMCTRKERTWANRDEYALRSMAQTRALSKALRLPLGFIVELAGYAATPADEMDQPDPSARGASERHTQAERARSGPAPQRTPEEQELADQIAALPGMSLARMSLLAEAAHVEKGTRANADQLREMLRIAQEPLPEQSEPSRGGSAGPSSSVDGQGAAVGSVAAAPTHTPHSEGSPEESGSDAATSGGSDGGLPPAIAEPPAAPTDEQILAAAGEGAEIVPPKPGTKAYRDLPNGLERSKAKAYWDEQKAAEPAQESLSEALGGPGND